MRLAGDGGDAGESRRCRRRENRRWQRARTHGRSRAAAVLSGIATVAAAEGLGGLFSDSECWGSGVRATCRQCSKVRHQSMRRQNRGCGPAANLHVCHRAGEGFRDGRYQNREAMGPWVQSMWAAGPIQPRTTRPRQSTATDLPRSSRRLPTAVRDRQSGAGGVRRRGRWKYWRGRGGGKRQGERRSMERGAPGRGGARGAEGSAARSRGGDAPCTP